MKLIIEIDNEMVCNDIKYKGLEAESETDEIIINALYNGIAYEERPHGEWILPNFYSDGVSYECNSCHIPHEGYIGKDGKPHGYDYCPNCGAYMRGAEND